jgi:hypothetical protein
MVFAQKRERGSGARGCNQAGMLRNFYRSGKRLPLGARQNAPFEHLEKSGDRFPRALIKSSCQKDLVEPDRY